VRRLATLAALAALALAPAARGGPLEISPVRIGLVGPERAASLALRNLSDHATRIQVRAFDWTQADGEDRHAPSRSLVASPPAFSLAPGQVQVVRLAILDTPDPERERAWRLVLDELPDAGAPAAGDDLPVRALTPVFLAPPGAAPARLRWSAHRIPGGLVLTAANDGGLHERLQDMTVTADDGRRLNGEAPLAGYVLAGSSRSWRLPGAERVEGLRVTAGGEAGPVQAEVRPAD
jgi:fimbrial chaperone protein